MALFRGSRWLLNGYGGEVDGDAGRRSLHSCVLTRSDAGSRKLARCWGLCSKRLEGMSAQKCAERCRL